MLSWPAISTTLPSGTPPSFPLQIILSSHRDPVGIQFLTSVGFSSAKENAISVPAFLLTSFLISFRFSLPSFCAFCLAMFPLINVEAPVNPCLPAVGF